MRWEIKDNWIKYGQYITSVAFFREWNKKYWYKEINMSTSSTLKEKDMMLIIKAGFNAIHNKKSFKNQKLYHAELFLIPSHERKETLFLSNSIISCNQCKKAIKTHNKLYVLPEHMPVPWMQVQKLKFFCWECKDQKIKLEKLKE